MHPDDLSFMVQGWSHSVQTGQVFEQEARYRGKEGQYRWHLTRGVPIRDEAGEVVFWTGSCTDIHDQKAAAEVLEEKIRERTRELQEANMLLERSNHELEQFAHVSSHDLQEPLRKIILFTELVRERSAAQLEPVAQGQLAKVSEAAQRMSASLRGLLNYTQVQQERAPGTVDLNEALRGILDDLEVVIREKGAVI